MGDPPRRFTEARVTLDTSGDVDEDAAIAHDILRSAGLEAEHRTGTAQAVSLAYYEIPATAVSTRLRPPYAGTSARETSLDGYDIIRHWCRETRGPYLHVYTNLLLSLPEPMAFHSLILSHHSGLRLTSMGFGSMATASRVFFEHYALSEAGGLNSAAERSIWANFEHDRQWIQLYVLDPQESPMGGHRLVVKYKSLRGVVTDFDEDSGRLHIYLLLKNPPALWKVKLDPEKDKPRTVEQESLQCKNWWYVRSVAGVPAPVLAGANAIRLTFAPDQVHITREMPCSEFYPWHRQRAGIGRGSTPSAELGFEIVSRLRSTGFVPAPLFAAVLVDRRLCDDVLIHDTGRTYEDFVGTLRQLQSRTFGAASGEGRGGFPMAYLVDALYSRGFAVTDTLVLELVAALAAGKPEVLTLLEDLRAQWKEKPDLAEEATENLLNALDSHKSISLVIAFRELCGHLEAGEGMENAVEAAAAQDDDDDDDDELRAWRADNLGKGARRFRPRLETLLPGGMLLRKIVVTPLRVLLMPRELMMGNRILRSYSEDVAIRLVFRAETGGADLLSHESDDLGACKPRFEGPRAPGMSRSLMDATVVDTMLGGVTAGDRKFEFLAWSNSQMREHSIYMFAVTRPPDMTQPLTIRQIRESLGSFDDIKTVSKKMARLAQCFTQSQEICELGSSALTVEADIVSWAGNPNGGGPYVFSDGVGRMPLHLARKVQAAMKLSYLPSAFQIRHSGFKGMLTVDPTLGTEKVVFRQSMDKFPSQSTLLEVVKHSQPSAVYLNRPLITILDQVSESQDAEVHARICRRMHEMLEKELFTVSEMLMRTEGPALSEWSCATELETRCALGLGVRGLYDAGLTLTNEPFFRSLLIAIHQFQIRMNLAKMKMEVSPAMGRTMYGIMDETGTLKYGQIFVQFSKSIFSPHTAKNVLQGEIMVTKNPCTVPGDVRLLEAVDSPALRHHCDVIVFPATGERPHPDEMAGSDLDGDEYAVFWDPELMFLANERPMDFPRRKQRDKKAITEQDIAEFFLCHMKQDMVGRMATAHLVAADRGSLFSAVCRGIAIKSTIAVDFPKSGVPADQLEEEEKQYSYPDFMNKFTKPAYRSPRLLGQLWRFAPSVGQDQYEGWGGVG